MERILIQLSPECPDNDQMDKSHFTVTPAHGSERRSACTVYGMGMLGIYEACPGFSTGWPLLRQSACISWRTWLRSRFAGEPSFPIREFSPRWFCKPERKHDYGGPSPNDASPHHSTFLMLGSCPQQVIYCLFRRAPVLGTSESKYLSIERQVRELWCKMHQLPFVMHVVISFVQMSGRRTEIEANIRMYYESSYAV